MSDHDPSACHDDDVAEVARRRGAAAAAGHRGDEATVRLALEDPAGAVRATALASLVRMGCDTLDDVRRGLSDPDETVRRRAAELASRSRADTSQLRALLLAELRPDGDGPVVEAASYSIGELGGEGVTDQLAVVARTHPDPLCREAAVAALGAIGAPAALPAILGALSDRPPIRRRAVLALAGYEGPEVDAAIERALEDRDWQVRQAAEDVSGAH